MDKKNVELELTFKFPVIDGMVQLGPDLVMEARAFEKILLSKEFKEKMLKVITHELS